MMVLLIVIIITSCVQISNTTINNEGALMNINKTAHWIHHIMNADSIPKTNVYKSCDETFDIISGIYLIQPNQDVEPFKVFCDFINLEMWTVIHQRFDKSVNFYKNYASYTKGFGPLTGTHWLGLEKIHQLTKNGDHELRVELEHHNLTKAYAHYSTFQVDSANNGFRLTISGYSGNAGDSMITEYSDYYGTNGMRFSTYDKDQDDHPTVNCAIWFEGAWWYNYCGVSNLNGPYYNTTKWGDKTMFWYYNFQYFALKTARMLIKRK